MRLSDKEYEEFKLLAETLRKIHPEVIRYNCTFRTAIALITEVELGTLKNSLFKTKKPNMSRRVFERFCNAYQTYVEQDEFYINWKCCLVNRFDEFEEGVNRSKSKKNKPIYFYLSENKTTIWDYIFKTFNESTWHCYEKHETCIVRSVIEFGALRKDGWPITISFPNPEQRTNEGIAKYHSENNVLDIISNDPISKNDYSHYILSIDISKEEIKLCTAHKTYKSTVDNGIVSKRVLLYKSEPTEYPGIFKINDSLLLKEVKSFFFPADLNILCTGMWTSMPCGGKDPKSKYSGYTYDFYLPDQDRIELKKPSLYKKILFKMGF